MNSRRQFFQQGSLGLLSSLLLPFPAISKETSDFSFATDTPVKEWVISVRFLTLQEGITKEQAKEWIEKEYLTLYRHWPGFNAMVGEPGISGKWGEPDGKVKQKCDFAIVYMFDSKKTLDRYFPPDLTWSDEIKKVLEEHKSIWDDYFGKYFVQDKYYMEQYLMFASAK
jgi:hypothetical protein